MKQKATAIPASHNRGERQDAADSIRPQNTSHGGEGCQTATFTRVEIRPGHGVSVTSVSSEVRRDDYAGLRGKGMFAGTRRKVERFYDQIDRDLAAWEREMFPRKKRRRRHGKRRHGKFVNLLGEKMGVRHA